MPDNRYDCHEMCKMTHDDETNKCDGNCIGEIPDFQDRIKKALEHEE